MASNSLLGMPDSGGTGSDCLHPAFYAGLVEACMMVCQDRIRIRQPTHSAGYSLLRLLQEHYGGRLTHITGKGVMLFFNGAARKNAFSTMVERDASVPDGGVHWARGYLCGAAKVTPTTLTVTSATAVPRIRAALSMENIIVDGDATRLCVTDPDSYEWVCREWMATPAPPPTDSLEDANARVEHIMCDLVKQQAQSNAIRTRAPLTAAQKAALTDVARTSDWDDLRTIVDKASEAVEGDAISLEQARRYLRRNKLPPYAFLETGPRRRARPMPDDIRACVMADLTAGLSPADVQTIMRRYLPADRVPSLQTLQKIKVSDTLGKRQGPRGTMWVDLARKYGLPQGTM
jgi:hypothetical protein